MSACLLKNIRSILDTMKMSNNTFKKGKKNLSKPQQKKFLKGREMRIMEQVDGYNELIDEVLEQIRALEAHKRLLEKPARKTVNNRIKQRKKSLLSFEYKKELYEKLLDPDALDWLKYVPQQTVELGNPIPEKFVGKFKDSDEEYEIPTWVVEMDLHPDELFRIMQVAQEGDPGGTSVKLQKPKDVSYLINKPLIDAGVKTQVSEVRYTAFNSDGKRLEIPRWWVKFVDDRIKPDVVSEEWIMQNFTSKFIERVKRQKETTFCQIMAGAGKADYENGFLVDLPNAPTIKYIQEGEDVCIGYSWASVLDYYTGATGCSRLIADISKKWKSEVVYSEITQYTNYVFRNTNYHFFEIEEYLPWETKSNYPTLLILIGEDGSTGHAVSTCGDWVFDSNLKKAQPISKDIFDWAVSTPEIACKCTGCNFALRLIPRPTLIFYGPKTKDDTLFPLIAFFSCFGDMKTVSELEKYDRTVNWRGTVFRHMNQKFTTQKFKGGYKNIIFGDVSYLFIMSRKDDALKQCLVYGNWLFSGTNNCPTFINNRVMTEYKSCIISPQNPNTYSIIISLKIIYLTKIP